MRTAGHGIIGGGSEDPEHTLVYHKYRLKYAVPFHIISAVALQLHNSQLW